MAQDGVRLAQKGLDVVVLVTEPFAEAARIQAQVMGMPSLRLAILPNPEPGTKDETKAQHGEAVIEVVMGALDSRSRVPVARTIRR